MIFLYLFMFFFYLNILLFYKFFHLPFKLSEKASYLRCSEGIQTNSGNLKMSDSNKKKGSFP